MQEKTIRTEFGTYAVRRHAPHPDRPWVIFIPGGPGISGEGEQRFLTPYLEREANLLWFDQLGNARAPAHDPGMITFRNAAADIAGLVRQEVDGPVHVIAHCAGFLTLHEIVREHRDVVSGATVIAPEANNEAFRTLVRGQIARGRLHPARLEPEIRSRLERFLETPVHEWGAAEVDLFLELYVRTDDWFALYWRRAEARAEFEELERDTPLAVDTFTQLAVEHFSRRGWRAPDYSGIPVQIIQGEGDPCTVWEEQGPNVMAMIPDARVTMIPEGHHWPHIERPEATMAAIGEFIRRLPRGSNEPVGA